MNLICLDQLTFDADGLIPAIAQDAKTGKVLMFAYMNRAALAASIETKQAVYYSRSRQKLWHKGEESGHFQNIVEIYTDCDSDVILLKIEQQGGIACHTGRNSCFYQKLVDDCWQEAEAVIKSSSEIYQ